MSMRRSLGPLTRRALLAGAFLLLGACGSEQVSGPSTDTSSSNPAVTGPRWSLIELIDLTGAGGEVTTSLSPLAGPAQVREFLAGIDAPYARRELRQAIGEARTPEGHRLMGAVVALTCEPPTTVSVDTSAKVPRISVELAEINRQCLAQTTTVALVSVREDLLG